MSALSKGSLSFRSVEMQLCAMLPARTHITHHMDWPLIPRASLALVQEGIDWALEGGGGLGEECVDGLLGLATSDRLWRLVEAKVAKAGWQITMDLFATASNARAERFCS